MNLSTIVPKPIKVIAIENFITVSQNFLDSKCFEPNFLDTPYPNIRSTIIKLKAVNTIGTTGAKIDANPVSIPHVVYQPLANIRLINPTIS